MAKQPKKPNKKLADAIENLTDAIDSEDKDLGDVVNSLEDFVETYGEHVATQNDSVTTTEENLQGVADNLDKMAPHIDPSDGESWSGLVTLERKEDGELEVVDAVVIQPENHKKSKPVADPITPSIEGNTGGSSSIPSDSDSPNMGAANADRLAVLKLEVEEALHEFCKTSDKAHMERYQKLLHELKRLQ
jgi:hypothetical protein